MVFHVHYYLNSHPVGRGVHGRFFFKGKKEILFVGCFTLGCSWFPGAAVTMLFPDWKCGWRGQYTYKAEPACAFAAVSWWAASPRRFKKLTKWQSFLGKPFALVLIDNQVLRLRKPSSSYNWRGIYPFTSGSSFHQFLVLSRVIYMTQEPWDKEFPFYTVPQNSYSNSYKNLR